MKFIAEFLIAGLLFWFGMHCFATLADADEFHLIQLEEVRVDYMNFLPGGRDPLLSYNGLPNRAPGKELDVHIDSTIANYFYWNNMIHSTTDVYTDTRKDDQFRVIGLNMELGVRLTSWLDVYYWHYSQHLLDTTYAYGGFPVLDAVGIHLYLYRKTTKDSIF